MAGRLSKIKELSLLICRVSLFQSLIKGLKKLFQCYSCPTIGLYESKSVIMSLYLYVFLYLYTNLIFCTLPLGLLFTIIHRKNKTKQKQIQ